MEGDQASSGRSILRVFFNHVSFNIKGKHDMTTFCGRLRVKVTCGAGKTSDPAAPSVRLAGRSRGRNRDQTEGWGWTVKNSGFGTECPGHRLGSLSDPQFLHLSNGHKGPTS